MDSIWNRMWRAAKLENALYEEVEANTALTGQAITVVIIVAIAGAIGGIISALTGGVGLGAIIGSVVQPIGSALIGYFVWAGVSLIVGKAFGGTADYGEMLRALGFAFSPYVLVVLAFIPFIGWLIGLIALIWVVVALIVALRQALDFSTGKAVITAVIGLVAFLIVMVIIQGILGALGLDVAALGGLLGGM